MDQEQFNQLISDDVVLFMKGTPESPQCGFSAQVVFILQELGAKYTAVNVFDHDKEQLKEFANWPTFPQLWVKQKLIGGCDIITELAQSGELEETIRT